MKYYPAIRVYYSLAAEEIMEYRIERLVQINGENGFIYFCTQMIDPPATVAIFHIKYKC